MTFVLAVWLISIGQVSSCILSSNDRTPLSLQERARRAEVVLSGYVRKTFKHDRTEEGSYLAEIRALRVLKGADAVAVTVRADTSERLPDGTVAKVYNVSNFGDKAMCYSDVIAGQTYVLFLAVGGDRRLAAKYDDIFGAAAEWSALVVESVLKGVGGGTWSDWSTCSVTCGDGGVQERERMCSNFGAKCGGATKERERRTCNAFKCQGTRDLLKIFNFAKHQRRGVRPLADRQGAYRIERKSHLRLPTYSLFPYDKFFPSDFTVLATVRATMPSSDSLTGGGNFLGITDENGRRRLALRLGSSLEFTYLNALGLRTARQKPAYFRINASVTDYQWHTLAVSLRKSSVEFHVDCRFHSTHAFNRSFAGSDIPVVSMMTIGYFPNTLKELNFEGDVEQLLISLDPKAATHHCSSETTKVVDPEAEILVMDASYNAVGETLNRGAGERGSGDGAEDDADSGSSGDGQIFDVEWSEWSPCSATCGLGVRKRTSNCLDNGRNLEECIESRMEKMETEMCHRRPCSKPEENNVIYKPAKLKPNNISAQPSSSTSTECSRCKNGATCLHKKICLCAAGFYGMFCEKAVTCSGCMNGGKCLKPNVCTCADGYSGIKCQEALCKPRCENGGRCIGPQRCACSEGYAPPTCTPICNRPCYNGGVCLAPAKCKCAKGYHGISCQTAVCKGGCKNGGRCISPDLCVCSSGFTGSDCGTPMCSPACQNGGVCMKPYTCFCKSGFTGSQCEKFTCNPSCVNDGVCVGPNKCKCPHSFTGAECETAICEGGCMNGGKCVGPSKCVCPPNYSGDKCDKKKCKKYQVVNEPYLRSYKRKVEKTIKEACSDWTWKMCTKAKVDYEMVQKTFYRTSYKCID